MTDCRECGVPQISVWSCDFCDEGACDFCYQEVWKQCPECSRIGCREHFDGMYCWECVAASKLKETEKKNEKETDVARNEKGFRRIG